MPAHLELTPAWRDLRAHLRRTVGDSTFEIWLAPLEPRDWNGEVLLLQAPPGTKAWISDRFGNVLDRSVKAVFGAGTKVAFAADSAAPAHASAAHASASDPVDIGRFIPRYTFEQFVIGDSNRLAHAASLAVAEAPSNAYNPLFLHAPPGLGKTHLLHAIGNYITAFDPTTTVGYTTVEAFTNGFINALNTRALDRFKHLYRDVDVLLIDDVQFLASKAKTEEEFFHTFNTLYDSGRQLVLTCDRLPRQLTGIEDRLRARFESGLVASLAPPDRPTRIAILKKRAALDRIVLPDPTVLDVIADRVTDNIRSLEGALIRVLAHHSLAGKPLDADLALAVLSEFHPATAVNGKPSTAAIQHAVAVHFDITEEQLVSSSRAAKIAWPRQLAIYLTRELTEAPLQAIGEAFGGRNHATVLHACKRVGERVLLSVEDAAELEAVRKLLTAARADRNS
jgi:chromosomal replication initiator protein